MFFQKFYDYQKEREAKTNKKVAFFSLITGAVGLAAGYLSNKENRENAKKVALDAANQAKDISSDAANKAKEYSKVAGKKLNEFKDTAAKKLDEIEDKIDEALNKDEEIELVPVKEEADIDKK
jgi:CRISPR/Cas system-associated protein Cas5 (RAMP superfamily)